MAPNGRQDLDQDEADHPPSRQRASAPPRSRKDKKQMRTRRSSTAIDSPPDDKPPDLEALRKAPLNHIGTRAEEPRKKMRYIGETITRQPVRRSDIEHTRRVSGARRRRKRSDGEAKPHRRKKRVDKADGGEYQSVYEGHDLQGSRGLKGTDVNLEEAESVDDSDAQSNSPSDMTPPKAERSKNTSPGHRANVVIRTNTSTRRQSEPIKRIHQVRRNSYGIDECPSISMPRTMPARQSSHASRPQLQRSTTTLRSKSDATLVKRSGALNSKTATSIAEPQAKKSSSLFSSLLRSTPATPIGLKKVTCLTCGSDDIPIIKTAKLACTHRMCHDCLRRIFNLSVTDPAHMPPKCCTSEHIPLKHVDKLFDQKFKKTWNRKFQEYTTRNRIYCPTRHCGEWIKPNHIGLENGRKVGKCKRCGTRVCCICNNKMHTSRECPKDPATKIFVDIAKKEGWQRCFNCSAMVELKEGCNHMTCRCTAEFCMVCGNKWKTCDCPWFNYEAVEADRLQHILPQGRRGFGEDDRRAPIRYQEEMDRRRHQERRDEALARRMQMLGVDQNPDETAGENNNGHGFGLGNAADHFFNQAFGPQARNILTGNFRQAARAAEALLNGPLPGRENALPPALPFEPDEPAPNAANQPAQLLNHDSTPILARNNAAGRPSNAQANPRRQRGTEANRCATDEPAEATVPLPPALPDLARRATLRSGNQGRQAGALGGLLTGSWTHTANERAAERRIEDWRSDVPVGEPADGVTLV